MPLSAAVLVAPWLVVGLATGLLRKQTRLRFRMCLISFSYQASSLSSLVELSNLVNVKPHSSVECQGPWQTLRVQASSSEISGPTQIIILLYTRICIHIYTNTYVACV